MKKQCLQDGALFEDPDVPAEAKTLFYSKEPPRPFLWKRPREIVKNPHFFKESPSTSDVVFGFMGQSWVTEGLKSLVKHEKLLYQVVPKDQLLDGKGYCGLFQFRFWNEDFSRWEEVVIDDRLPTYNGKLVFMQSNENDVFWAALLEKALAKRFGTFEGLKRSTKRLYRGQEEHAGKSMLGLLNFV